MKRKKSYKMPICVFLMLFVFFPLASFACCSAASSFSLALNIFIADILYVLFAMLFWFISPIGVLFLLGIKLFFSKNASVVRKNFALLLQFLSFLSWSSLMFILLIVYIDSISYKVLDLGGNMLNLAIKSGFGFIIFMLILAVAEKQIISKQKHSLKREQDDDNDRKKNSNNLKNKEKENIKKSGIECGGIKQKIRRKFKENLKKIVDKEIDKRL
ncbi:MAG: hypothetical protein KAQ64_02245 [Candidatus Pacebacteria bacterium]|nr:hypothetical protein [Candidatus Paceibacterota bacterium]